MIHGTDPSPRLEAAFLRIERERMAGVPVLNPALRVQAVGFARWQGHWLGTLVTPWFLNLVLLRGQDDGWQPAAEGQRVFHRFAAGDFAFLGSDEPETGPFLACSLVSPMDQFSEQRAALATAEAALALLHQPPAAPARGCAPAAPPKEVRVDLPKPLSKRAFLFGRGA